MSLFHRRRKGTTMKARAQARGWQLFKNWGILRKIGLVAILLFSLVLLEFLSVPVGVVVLVTLSLLQFLWKEPMDENDPTLGTLTPGTAAFKVAACMTAIQKNRASIYHPRTTIGMGPPTDDPENLVTAGWWPPTRLSSWWALFLSLPVAVLDIPLHYVTFPATGWKPPIWLSIVASVFAWYVVFQIIAAGIRHEGLERQYGGDGNIAPAVLINKLLTRENLKEMAVSLSLHTGITAAIGAILTLTVWLALGPTFGLILLFASLSATVFAFLISLSNRGTSVYRADWETNIRKAQDWAMIFDSVIKGANQPIFVSEDNYPSLQSFLDGGGEREDYDPHSRLATFSYPPGLGFRDVEKLGPKLAASLQTDSGLPASMVMMMPVPMQLPDGTAISGTDGGHSFYCFWTDLRMTLDDVLNEGFDDTQIEHFITVDATVMSALRSIKGVGSLVISSIGMYTTPESRNRLIEVTIQPVDGTPLSLFINNIRSLTDQMGVKFVRCIQDRTDNRTTIKFFIGDNPFDEGTKYEQPASFAKNAILTAEYLWIFTTLRLTGQEGAPMLECTTPISDMVDESVFSIPPGIGYDDILRATERIKTTSGNEFIEIRPGVPKQKTTGIPGAHRRLSGRAHFTMVSATKHPLDRLFKFSDYEKQILGEGRVLGRSTLKSAVGVFANDQLAYDDFDNASPHMLIAGSSGSGKCNSVATQVFTASGWKKLGDIQVGDIVYDMDGNPTKVIYTYDPYVPDEGYYVTFSTGETISACGDHLWTVTPYDERQRIDHTRDCITNAKLEPRIEKVQPFISKWDANTVDTSRLPDYVKPMSAWMDIDGELVEATSWINYGRMSEDHPHVSSRRAQSAIRGIPPILWGLIASSLEEVTENRIRIRFPKERLNIIQSALDQYKLIHCQKYCKGGKDAILSINRFNDFMDLIWEDKDKTLSSLIREVLDVIGFTPDFLAGAMMGATVDGDTYTWINNIDTVETVLDLYEIPFDKVDGHVVSSSEKLSLIQPSSATVDHISPYLTALYDACGTSLKDRWLFLTISDPSIRYHLLERGYISSVNRTNMGVERIAVSPTNSLSFKIMKRENLTEPEALEYIRGLAAASGTVSDGKALIPIPEQSQDMIHHCVDMVPTARIVDTVDTIFDEPCQMVEIDAKYVSVCSSDFLDIAQEVTTIQKYDNAGRAVMSIPELIKETGITRIVLEKYIKDMRPTAIWRAPTIQRFTTGIRVKTSADLDLYPVADVYRAALNTLEGRMLDTNEAMATLTTRDIAKTPRGKHGHNTYSVPLNPVYCDGATIDELPIHPYVLGCYLGDGTVRTSEISGADPEIFDKIESLGYTSKRRLPGRKYKNKNFRIARFTALDGTTLGAQLRELGVSSYDGGNIKHIPDIYKYASFEARLELLRGLMDTDGCNNSQITFTTRNKLAYDTLEVLRSMGIKVSTRLKYVKPYETPFLDMTFTTDLMLHHLSRKKEAAIIAQRATQDRVYITSIEPIPEDEMPLMRCITVDSPTATYRIGETLIPTHNSVVLENMILNLAGKNDPRDLQLRIIEPKIGTQVFEQLDSVTHYADSWVPNPGQFYVSARDMFKDLVEEMENRNKIMRFHPAKPEKLETAREIAFREGPTPDGKPHPMLLPYIVLIVEECALLFAPSPAKEDRELQAEIVYYATRLSRESRSAGIHMVFLTQYPTNESIPSTIRQQCRRLGLKCTNDFASRVVIDQGGLEKMERKGAGMVMSGGQYREFRGFLVNRSGNDGDDDVLKFINRMPKNANFSGQSIQQTPSGLVLPDIEDSVFAFSQEMLHRQAILDSDEKLNSRYKGFTDADLPSETLTVNGEKVQETAIELEDFMKRAVRKLDLGKKNS